MKVQEKKRQIPKMIRTNRDGNPPVYTRAGHEAVYGLVMAVETAHQKEWGLADISMIRAFCQR